MFRAPSLLCSRHRAVLFRVGGPPDLILPRPARASSRHPASAGPRWLAPPDRTRDGQAGRWEDGRQQRNGCSRRSAWRWARGGWASAQMGTVVQSGNPLWGARGVLPARGPAGRSARELPESPRTLGARGAGSRVPRVSHPSASGSTNVPFSRRGLPSELATHPAPHPLKGRRQAGWGVRFPRTKGGGAGSGLWAAGTAARTQIGAS